MLNKEVIKTITFVGDSHFTSTTPKSRVDDYAETSIEKLESLLDICITKGYKHLVHLGDFSHIPNQPLSYVNAIIEVFQKFQDNGIKWYGIYGNHDLVHNDLDNSNKSLLGLMFKTGLIKELRTELFTTKEGYDIALHGYHYPEAIQPLMAREIKGKVNICVMHRYFEYRFSKSSLDRNQLSQLGYQVYATGHEHPPYDVMKFEDFTLIRPGRFMRGTSDKHNVEDGNVYIDTISFNGSIEQPRLTCIRDIIPTKLPSNVFSILALNKDKESNKFLSDLSSKVSNLLDMMDSTSGTTNNVYSVLDKLQIDIRIKDRVESYLHKEGIYRNDSII